MKNLRPGFALLLVSALLVAGCADSGYVLRQGWRQLKLLRSRQPVERLLRRRDLSDAVREKLVVSQLARRYAEEVLGLRRTAAYTSFVDTGKRPVAWNLSACPKDRLQPKTWRFLVVGRVPYLGFLDEGEARRRRRQLEAEGLDTELRPVNAWSSLGWFNDPLTSGMLREGVERLSEVIIHEMTHTTIFVPGQVAFNESLAVFVGDLGARNFLAQLYGPLSPEVQRQQESLVRRRQLAALVEELYQRLQRLYAGPLSTEEKLRQRQAHFRWAQQRYREMVPDRAHLGRFGRGQLNNAVLLSYGRYHRGLLFHERVYRKLGNDLGRLVALYRAAQRRADPIQYIARRSGVAALLPQRH